MKHYRLLLGTCFALEAIGISILVFLGPMVVRGTGTIELAPGADSIEHLEVDTLGGGAVSGDFTTASGRPIHFMVLDDGQYQDFLAGRSYSTQFSEYAASGSFSYDRPAEESCHILVGHATETEGSEKITVSHTVRTMDWPMTFAATGMFAAGAFAGGLAMIKRAKDRKAARGPLSPYIDVVIFDEGSKRGH